MRKPDYLFEVSWEVCNKIGGIHTVISTKATTSVREFDDHYIAIGPDVWRDNQEHPEFEEDPSLFAEWREQAARDGIRVRIGRWKIESRPIAFVLDFTPLFNQKDAIFSSLWETYRLDSISGRWDYIEPALFGYAAGQVIEHYMRFYDLEDDQIVAQFHEWQTGAGLLYIEQYQPQIGTIFTTHATTVGRSMAGNNQPLYSVMDQLNGEQKARELNVVAKHSLENRAAKSADTFTTVSKLTARECKQFHERVVDVVLPNGFEDGFVPGETEFDGLRDRARKKMLEVASALTGETIPGDACLVATSGRYEFRNKGLDLFIDTMGELNRKKECKRDIVAFLLIPANHYGPRKDLLGQLHGEDQAALSEKHLSHNLHYAEHDLILNRIKSNGLNNGPEDKVKVIFVPSYLNGNDGIFDLPYYHVLIGLDLTIFPSYYEPWGYTPLESLAFHVPTVTTSLTGFGIWVKNEFKKDIPGITVVPRDDFNDKEVVQGLIMAIADHCTLEAGDEVSYKRGAYEVSRIALWDNLFENYMRAYDHALESSSVKERVPYEKERIERLPETEQILEDIQPNWRQVRVHQRIPDGLKQLEELSKNLWWSWNQEAKDLFECIDGKLWEKVGENPVELLENLSYDTLKTLEKNQEFMKRLQKVHLDFQEYITAEPKDDLPSISYFSMEFGIHNSLKTYSGGLGLLAGDYLKEASDYNVPIVGIGLLYRFGYFRQVISAGGEQIALEDEQHFSRLPVLPVRGEDGKWMDVQIVFPGRTVHARLWKVLVGRIPLYLLDTDYAANQESDRMITNSLYGGDHENRLKQEILLGIGGTRALRSIGVETDLYHCNEGHAAFTGLERLRECIQYKNMTFPEAVEIVRASSLFTTHTPVPAGHDSFEEDLLRTYVGHYPERLGISWNQFMNLGRYHANRKDEKFSMSVLAVKLSQEVNGVSKVHGRVSREMFSGLYPGYMTEELHVGHVTNGVHLPTWLGPGWGELYRKAFGEDCFQRQEDRLMWDRIKLVPDNEIWNLKSDDRAALIKHIKERLANASTRMMANPARMVEIATALDENALTIGFARRFATYKRAHLLFRDLDRLASIVNDPEKPVQFLFAGKAHPRDIPGQDLIKMIVEISNRPEFIGKIVFLQNYDILLAKRMVRGVDIWLNTPTRPLEASGTSGEKAVMNGTMHFSVLDGWWAEGYRDDAGWALPIDRSYENQDLQDELDAERLYTILENDIIEKFYNRNNKNLPEDWVGMIRSSIAHVAPEFTMNRMIRDYINKYYLNLWDRTQKLRKNDYHLPKELAYWKNRILENWKSIKVQEYQIPDLNKDEIMVGNSYSGKVTLDLGILHPDEIGVELVIARVEGVNQNPSYKGKTELQCSQKNGSVAEYTFVQEVDQTGVFKIGFRIFPKHKDLPHRLDFPLVKWL